MRDVPRIDFGDQRNPGQGNLQIGARTQSGQTLGTPRDHPEITQASINRFIIFTSFEITIVMCDPIVQPFRHFPTHSLFHVHLAEARFRQSVTSICSLTFCSYILKKCLVSDLLGTAPPWLFALARTHVQCSGLECWCWRGLVGVK